MAGSVQTSGHNRIQTCTPSLTRSSSIATKDSYSNESRKMSSEPPTLGKRRSSARLAAGPPVEYFKRQQSSTLGLTGALAGLATSGEADEPSAKSRKVSVAGNKSAFAMFQAIDQKPPEKSAKEQARPHVSRPP